VRRAWTHWGTSQHFTVMGLPAHDAGTGLDGPVVGRTSRGGDFVLDPFDAYRAGLVTNPNVVVAGAIGSGKSTLVKMMVDRALSRGRRVVVVDPKGEYGSLAAAHDVTPLHVGRAGWCWPPERDAPATIDFVQTLLAHARRRALSAEENYVLGRTWREVSPGAPPRVLAALYERLGVFSDDPRASAEKSLALELHRFVAGDLAGLYDGPGDPLDVDAPLVVLDISHYWGSDLLSLASLAAVAAAQHLGRRCEAGYVVMDEAWALLGDDASLRWLQGSWKLARARGLAHVLVLHRWSDTGAVGEAQSSSRARARGLLRECEITWLFRQPPDEVAEMTATLRLTPREVASLGELARGQALVRYGPARSLVQVTPTRRDGTFVDSDAAMRSRDA